MERKLVVYVFICMPYLCREVLQGQGYFGLALAFELKLLVMGWYCIIQLSDALCLGGWWWVNVTMRACLPDYAPPSV